MEKKKSESRNSAKSYPGKKGTLQQIKSNKPLKFVNGALKSVNRSDKEFLSIVNEMPHMIYRINLKGELTFANEAYSNSFGLPANELLGKTAYDLHPKHLADKYTADNKKVFKDNKTFYTIEENVHKQTGKKEIVEVFKIPIHDKSGKIIGLQGVFWNITDRIEIQKNLKNMSRDYKEIFDATSEAIFIHDSATGQILDVNQTATNMYGYTKKEMLALSISDISSGDSLYNLDSAIKHIIRSNEKSVYTFEWRAKKKGGKLFWVEVSLRKSKIGGKGRVLAVVRDITKRKEDEKALFLSQVSINTSKDAVIWFNKSGRILFVNEAAFEMLKYSRSEIYKLTIADIEENINPYYWQKRLEQLNNSGSLTIETIFTDNLAISFPVEITVSYYRYEKEEVVFAVARDISERKLAETKLIGSEKKYRDMTEQLPQGIYESDLNGKVTYANKKMFELLQRSQEELEKGFNVIDSLVPEDRHKAIQSIKNIFEGKAPHPQEYNMKRKDGSVFPVAIFSNVIEIENIPIGFRGIIVDLSEKIALEKEKQEHDSLFSLLFEKAGDANLLIEEDRFVDCNETTVKVLKAASKDDIINKHPWEFSPEYQPDGEKSYDKAVRFLKIAFNEGSHRFEWVQKRVDNTLFFVEIVLTAIPIKGKWYLHTSWRDITDKKNAEEKEKIYYQRLEKLLEIERKILSANSSEKIAQAALKHIRLILDCHRASVLLFDKDKDLFTVIALDSVIDTKLKIGDNYTLSNSPLRLVREGQVEVINDMSIVYGLSPIDNLLVEEGISSSVSVPLLVNNEVVGILYLSSSYPHNFNEEKIKMAKDVSVSISLALQHSSFIEQINRHNIELEKRIDERTSQLRQTISELESFSYSVSHDLRAPLRSIGGFSQAIIDDYAEKLDNDGKVLLKRIVSASQRMSDLIDALLLLARITRSEMNVERVDFSAIVFAAANEIKRHNEERTNVEFKIQPGLMARGDQKLLRVAIENLLSNSWKFSRNTSKAVIEFGQKIINNDNVFFVKDNGVGFDMTYAGKLFGPFQRLHTIEEFEGTGIGLATTKRIILRHNGTIWAESKVGEGATFYFTLKA